MNQRMYKSSIALLTFTVVNLFLFFSSSTIVFGQEKDSSTLTLEDDTSFYNDEESNMLIISMSFSNNTIKFKDIPDEKMPSMLTDFTYYTKFGLWSGINYSNYINADMQTFETELQAGFQKAIGGKFDINLYYSWHNFKGDSAYQGMIYNHTLNLSTGFTLGAFEIYADNYFMFGNTDNHFLDLSFSGNIEATNIFVKDDYLSISPTLSTAYGTDYWLFENMTIVEKIRTIYLLRLQGYTAQGFSHQGFDIFLPLIYNINNFSVQFAYLYSIPSLKFKAMDWSNQTGFMISLIYSPNL